MVDAAYEAALISAVGRVTRRVDIFEADGVTPFYYDAPVEDGSVTVDADRAERRMFDLVIDNESGDFTHTPSGFWYDKILKIYRGVETGTASYESQLGEFVIDSIKEPHFPAKVSVTGRDRTKTLILDKFAVPTSFSANSRPEQVIRTIAINAGVTKLNLPVTGSFITEEKFFDAGTPRWDAIKDLATAFGYEVYFDPAGFLTMRKFADPASVAKDFTFKTGKGGTLASFEKSTTDSRLYNHVVVTGTGAGDIPVVAQSQNNEPSSPTRVARIGRRTYQYESQFISTTQQAQVVADNFIKVSALEQYDINMASLVIPYLEVGRTVEFLDPTPVVGDPTRFLLTSFTVPLGLGTMDVSSKRVTVVGS